MQTEYKSVVGAGLASMAMPRQGRGYCARCGIEMRVRPDVPLHVCAECRRDKVWLAAVTTAATEIDAERV